MAEPARKIKAAERCDVSGCKGEAVRSVSGDRAEGVFSSRLDTKEPRRVHLCREHYRELKKATKKDRELDSLGWEQ